jgi:phage tail-like protein
MRGIVPDLVSGVPVAHRLPGIYQDDDFTLRFVSAFDDALAPIIATLDGLAGYVDPWLAPDDFLDWLAGWVGVGIDDAWTLQQRRAIVSGAALVHRRRGTAAGIKEAVRLAVTADCDVEVLDSGGTVWSPTPGGQVPGSAPPVVTVRVHVHDTDAVDVRRVEALVASVKPAHVAHVVEVVGVESSPPESPEADTKQTEQTEQTAQTEEEAEE